MNFQITCLNNDTVGMDKGMWGEHGVSYLVEHGQDRILFDTGTSWEIVAHNIKTLDLPPEGISHIVLSHGHYDHTGGLMGALDWISGPTVVADPLLFNRKISRNPKTGEEHEIGIPHSREKVAEKASLLLTEEAVEIAPGITVTGRIPRNTRYEKTPDYMLVEMEDERKQDIMLDDRSIVLETEKGLVLLTGCCHAGLINTLQYVRSRFQQPVYAAIGGIHLVGASQERIERTIEALATDFPLAEMYFNHCTGLPATIALTNAFGERVKPCLAGSQLEF